MTTQVIEIATFKTAEGVLEQTLLAADAVLLPWVMAQQGFVTRSLAQNEDGSWMDCVTWADLATAKAAGEAIMGAPGANEFLMLVIPDSLAIVYYTVKVRA
jgi:hypothetical protein